MTTTILDHVRAVLERAGYNINGTRDLPHGHQIRCAGGEVVCAYTTGKVVPQGKNAGVIKALFEANPMPKHAAVAKPKAIAPVEKPAAEIVEEPLVPRFPPDWSWEPWDGVMAPF